MLGRKKALVERKKAIPKRKIPQAKTFSKTVVLKDIMLEAKILGLSEKSAEVFATKVAERVAKWAERREMVTQDDIDDKVASEIARYNKDLAFIYKNRGKII